LKSQTAVNFGRYGAAKDSTVDRVNAAQGWALTNQLGEVRVGNLAAENSRIAKLQAITLQQMPVIPLWYSGLWAQWKDNYWTNWPSAASGQGHYLPSMWRAYLNMTGIDMIDHLVPS
jgi:peptide/nickel transport system substrate-binding protein